MLDYIQLRNGLDKVVIYRDDIAGFRLDKTFTHKQHPVLQHKSKPEVKTRTSLFIYVTSNIISSYGNSEYTCSLCFGVAKPQKITSKNPDQHSADLKVLGYFDEVKPWLEGKKVGCICVDGAMDENH